MSSTSDVLDDGGRGMVYVCAGTTTTSERVPEAGGWFTGSGASNNRHVIVLENPL